MSTTHDESGATAGLSRRTLLRRVGTGAVGIAVLGSTGTLFGAGSAVAAPSGNGGANGKGNGGGKGNGAGAGYGPLVPDPAGLLALPAGFSYRVVAHAGQTTLESGELTPSDPDGMAAFVRRGGNGSVLVLNHEISGSEPFRTPTAPGLTYDDTCFGGTTTVEVDKDGNRVAERVSLAGTYNNCAGGRTPWDTWISCEETEVVRAKRHGYCFEVDPYDQARNQDPRPIKALGRYAHEAVVVDPQTWELYLTEDASNPNGLLYRWTPPADALPLGDGSLRELADDAGVLEALRATDSSGAVVTDLSVATEIGTTYTAGWTVVPDRDATTTSTRKQLATGQVTRSRKLEGMWWGDGGAYFVSSFARPSDGSAASHDGQVWFLDPLAGTVELRIRFAATADQDGDVDGPDNITVSPYGGVIIAEDGDGTQHLVGSTASGETFFFARNEVSDSEFTGPTFSHDRKTLFASIQGDGYTFAITGPFTKQR